MITMCSAIFRVSHSVNSYTMLMVLYQSFSLLESLFGLSYISEFSQFTHCGFLFLLNSLLHQIIPLAELQSQSNVHSIILARNQNYAPDCSVTIYTLSLKSGLNLTRSRSFNNFHFTIAMLFHKKNNPQSLRSLLKKIVKL